MLKKNYDKSADVLCLHLSDAPVVRDVTYGWHVSVGYAPDGQAAEITILDALSLLGEGIEPDEQRIVLTERESLWLLDRLEHPRRPNEHFVRAMARRREMPRGDGSSGDNDEYAWMTRQLDMLRTGRLDGAQVEALVEYFEAQVRLQRDDLCALLRAIAIRLRRLEVDPHDQAVVERLAEFRGRAANELRYSPSLRGAAEPCLETVWQQARHVLAYHLAERDLAGLPEHCPYTLDEMLGDAVRSAAGQTAANRSDASGETLSIITHITPAGGNVFLDLGFPAEEAEQLKRESDRRMAATDERASQEMLERQARQERFDADSRPDADSQMVQEGTAESPPAPPDGYASWLDYAVATMDTRSVEIEWLFLDNPASRTAMHEAVRAELVALRRKAGEL